MIPEAALEAARQDYVLRALRPTALLLAVLYTGLGAAHLVVLPASVASTMAPLAWSSAAVCLGVNLLLRRHVLAPAWAHPAAALLLAVVLANCVVHLGLEGNPQLTDNYGLLLLGAACLLLSYRWLSAVLLTTLLSWGAVAVTQGGGDDWTHAGFSLLVTVLLSWLVHTVRFVSHSRLERQRLELQLTNQRLAEAVDRSRELAARAEAANQAKVAFLANMSHETRTPLNAIMSLTNLLLESRLNPAQHESAEHIRGAAESLLGILDDVLDFAQLESGGLTLQPTECDLREVVEAAFEDVARRSEARGLELSCHLAAELPWRVSTDVARLRQVLTQLLGNALKFTPSGAVQLQGTVKSTAGDRANLRCMVIDTGVGIPAEAQQRLFEFFSQADNSSRRRYGGAGLGLAIAHRVVTLLGGAIGFDSEVGRGSSFWFEVPLVVVPTAAPAATPGGRALVVEDHGPAATELVARLAQLGWQAEAVSSVASAQQRLATQAFDAWLVDSTLPDGAGLALLQTPAAHPAARRILLGAQDQQTPAVLAAAADGIGFLSKPLRQSRLQIALEHDPADWQPAAIEVSNRAGPWVLVVDDNTVNQIVTQRLAERFGYRVAVASNGLAALQQLRQQSFAAVLMDCQMPEMDGYEATSRIRTEGLRDLPIIALTAHAMAGEEQRCREAGMDDYLTKPVSAEQLHRCLHRWAPLPMPNTTPGLLDDDLIGELRLLETSSPGFLASLIERFLTQWDNGIEDLRAALDLGEFDSGCQLAHKLKGSAAALAASSLAEMCGELEELLRANRVDNAWTLLDQMDRHQNEVAAALQNLVGG
ncbi:MAG: response regulator [Fimbriimonadaceae bacterium]|nr:response regulator [Fimbriimonadaceae bacterium]